MKLLDDQSIKRASKAFRCLPLNKKFYATVKEKGLTAEHVFQKEYQYQVNGLKWFKNSTSVEAAFRWLITIGILRREVDGQGLTSRIRLTPLGRQILSATPELPEQKAGFHEQISNFLNRKWPLR